MDSGAAAAAARGCRLCCHWDQAVTVHAYKFSLTRRALAKLYVLSIPSS